MNDSRASHKNLASMRLSVGPAFRGGPLFMIPVDECPARLLTSHEPQITSPTFPPLSSASRDTTRRCPLALPRKSPAAHIPEIPAPVKCRLANRGCPHLAADRTSLRASFRGFFQARKELHSERCAHLRLH